MNCPLCGYSQNKLILKKQAIPIYTNADDDQKLRKEVHPCELQQCVKCGHVFQKITERLKSALGEIYTSNHAQITSPPGVGSWGQERALYLIEKIERTKKYKKDFSILEIGCANGHILKILKERGFRNLMGIEPSLEKTERSDGILFIKEFVKKTLELGKYFDFIFSFGVYEHVEDIDSITDFSKKHLKDKGELFIYVPNCQSSLDTGDPNLFTHQHVQYFVENSLRYHLANHGLNVVDDLSDQHALCIYAAQSGESRQKENITKYDNYQKKIDNKLKNIHNVLQNNRLIVHGACNALNNILGWTGGDYDFVLVDNDTMKHGKRFFNKTVHSIPMIEIENYKTVFIVPTVFSHNILELYKSAGFKGRFQTLDTV